MIENIIEFAKNNTALFIGIITACITVLSTILAVLEYFEKKAYYDYFFVEDYARDSARSGFHPEYLSFAILIFCAIFGVYLFLDSLSISINRFVIIFLIICVPTVLSFFICKLIFSFYHSAQKNDMRCWKDAELKQISKDVAKQKSLKWFSVSAIFSLGYFINTVINNVLVFIVFIVACIYVYIKFEYECRKKLMKKTTRFFNIVKEGLNSYAILNTHNDVHYCVETQIKGGTANLFLDRMRVFHIDDKNIYVERKYITGFNRILNNTIVEE